MKRAGETAISLASAIQGVWESIATTFSDLVSDMIMSAAAVAAKQLQGGLDRVKVIS